jgi:hypothetical protein
MLTVVVASAETSEGESCCRVCVAKQVRGSALIHAATALASAICARQSRRETKRVGYVMITMLHQGHRARQASSS